MRVCSTLMFVAVREWLACLVVSLDPFVEDFVMASIVSLV